MWETLMWSSSQVRAICAVFVTRLPRSRPGRCHRRAGLPGGSVTRVMTAYGTVDCLLERGRQDWGRLRRRAGLVPVADVPVLVAARADAWDLRRRHKDKRR